MYLPGVVCNNCVYSGRLQILYAGERFEKESSTIIESLDYILLTILTLTNQKNEHDFDTIQFYY